MVNPDKKPGQKSDTGIGKADIERLTGELHKKERQVAKLKKELLKKEEEIRQAESRFGDFYDLAATCFMTLDSEGVILELNLAAAEMLGIDKEAALNTYAIHYLSTDSIGKFNKLLYDSKYAYDTFSDNFCIRTGSGEYRDINLTAVPFLDYKNKKVSFSIFFYDITEMKKLERLLYESENRFRLIAEATPVMIWMTDVNGRIEYMNRTEHMFLGLNGKVTMDSWMETRHPEDREKFLDELVKATREENSFSMEIRARNYNGIYRWLICTAVPRFLENGTFAGLIGSGTDITEEKNTGISLKKSLEEKEILIREVHHRVKNNMGLILSLINLQSSLLDDKKMIEVLKVTQDRVRSMAMLHDKMYQTQNVKWVNSKEYLNDLVSSLFSSFNLSLKIRLKLNIWEKQLPIGLSISIGLIINELVTNALKYAFPDNREGEIDVDLRPSSNHELYLLVRDNGIGMPENFDTNSAKSFGLMLVKTLVDQHGGRLELIQHGSTEFHITLPYENI